MRFEVLRLRGESVTLRCPLGTGDVDVQPNLEDGGFNLTGRGDVDAPAEPRFRGTKLGPITVPPPTAEEQNATS